MVKALILLKKISILQPKNDQLIITTDVNYENDLLVSVGSKRMVATV